MTIKTYSIEEAIEVSGSAPYKHFSTRFDPHQWAKFSEANINEDFIQGAIDRFYEITPDLQGLEALCEYILGGPEPNAMIMSGTISCRVAPGVADGSIDDAGHLSLGVCWDGGWTLILNPIGRSLALTFGSRANHCLRLDKPTFDKAKEIIEQYGENI